MIELCVGHTGWGALPREGHSSRRWCSWQWKDPLSDPIFRTELAVDAESDKGLMNIVSQNLKLFQIFWGRSGWKKSFWLH